MQELIIYLLKSAGLFSLFYCGYHFLLKHDTSFRTNRFFLLSGVLTSLLLPLLEITRTVEVVSAATPLFLENFSAEAGSLPAEQDMNINVWQIAGGIYLLGLSFFLLKFLFQLFSLLKLIYSSKTKKEGNYHIIEKAGNTQPFSFFNFIIYDPLQHSSAEQELILTHEKSHAKQWHSVDQLITSLSVYLLWFNPLAWLYRKSVIQNLEYLADKEVVAAKVSKTEYQKTLLKICTGSTAPVLTNQFYQSLIKNRIIMLNKNTSQKSHFWKVFTVLPFLLLFIFTFSVKTEARAVAVQQDPQITGLKISAVITKETEEKALRSYEELFRNQGAELVFKDLQYSNGILTGVVVNFSSKTGGKTESIKFENSEGIPSFSIQTSGTETVLKPSIPAEKKPGGTLEGIGKEPLYLLSGKEYSTDQLINKYLEIKGEWNVIQPREARKKFGSKAKDGAIIISEHHIVEDLKEALKEIDLKQLSVNKTFIQVRKNEVPTLTGVNFNAATTISSDSRFQLPEENFLKKPNEIIAIQSDNKKNLDFSTGENQPLIFINGEEKKKGFNMNSVNEEKIKSVTVLKVPKSVEKYGEKGKNGVIEIELKPEGTNETPQDTAEKDKTFKFSIPQVTHYTFTNTNKNSLTVRDVGNADPDASKPLYVIDGEEMSKDFDPETISPSEIKSMKVLKEDEAITKYGSKASNGAIEIIIKK